MKKIYLLFIFSVFVCSCEDTLTLTDPTQITQDQALADGGIEGVALTMYNTLQGTGYWGARMVVVGDVMADNSQATFVSNRYATDFDNTPTSSIGIWGASYETIQAANTLLRFVDESDVSDVRKAELSGEAQFLRALAYHDLVKTFAYDPGVIVDNFDAGVVLRTEPVEGASQADFRARSTVDEIYAQIISDLQAAINNLNNDGPNFRATQAAAQGLLARVYLHQKNFAGAITQATNAMNSGVGDIVETDDYIAAWRGANHPEAIFELRFDAVLENVGANNSLASVTTPLFWGDLALTDDLVGLFEVDDVRTGLFFQTTVSTGSYTYQSKWTGSTGTTEFDDDGVPLVNTNTTFSDNVPIIRYSEMLLIRAEAYAETNQESLAVADVNTLRAQRGVGDISSSGTALMDDILDERRRELMFEGHRWFTLKRRGMDIPKPQGNISTISYDNFKLLSPIPQAEVDLSPVLNQNPGY
ncbi:MAG: RagB/SusD family nutrient uptake outer membrane protein [Bacteroidota bacterium]